jgi:hypothetical protein
MGGVCEPHRSSEVPVPQVFIGNGTYFGILKLQDKIIEVVATFQAFHKQRWGPKREVTNYKTLPLYS